MLLFLKYHGSRQRLLAATVQKPSLQAFPFVTATNGAPNVWVRERECVCACVIVACILLQQNLRTQSQEETSFIFYYSFSF